MRFTTKMGWLLAFAVAASSLHLATAGDPAKIDIRGSITKMTPASDEAKKKGLVAVLMVEGEKSKDTGYDKASVKVMDKTAIKKMVGKDRKDAKFEDLKVGAKVTATFTGPVLESYPVQATAKEIVILEEAK
jgi:beta-N-acetylhexosaminidase